MNIDLCKVIIFLMLKEMVIEEYVSDGFVREVVKKNFRKEIKRKMQKVVQKNVRRLYGIGS